MPEAPEAGIAAGRRRCAIQVDVQTAALASNVVHTGLSLAVDERALGLRHVDEVAIDAGVLLMSAQEEKKSKKQKVKQ